MTRARTKTISKLQNYRVGLGFDLSTHKPFTKYIRIACSQCQALMINSVPTHETGCPNETKECKGCYNRIPVSSIYVYCEDCRDE
jgi:hypothetical protein